MLARAVRAVAVAGGRAFSAEAAVQEVVTGSGSTIGGGRDTLGRRLLSLIFPKRSAVITLNKWAEEGKTVQKYQLNRIVRELRTNKRYKHALEICEWMRTQHNIKLLPGDYALHLDLICKVRGLSSAEKFFEDLPEAMIGQETCSALLHTYAQHNLVDKAEAMLQKMSECGFLNCPLPYNHMLTLYVSNGQSEKIKPLIQELIRTTSPDVVTYNLLLGICANRNDVDGAEKILRRMEKRKIDGDWVTHSTVTSLYTNAGKFDKAKDALKEMENKTSRKVRVAFASLITLHANLSDKDGMYRVWKKMESVFCKRNDAEYMSMISSLVKLGDIEGAENIYDEWESVSGRLVTRIPHILLQAYTKEDSMEKAEKLHQRMTEKGFVSTYGTWETLALGYLRRKEIPKVLECLKNALSSVKKWEPNMTIVKEVFDELETRGDTKCAEEFLVVLRKAGYITTDTYNALLRTYARAGQMPLLIAERMKKDKLELNEETCRLLKLTSKLCVGEVPDVLY